MKKDSKINMVRGQVQPYSVNDPSVISAMLHVPREAFVPPKYQDFAYADWTIPLPHQELMLSPQVEGRLLHELQLSKKDSVLEVGTGSGYFSALLGLLSKQVLSVDCYRDFSDQAALAMIELGIHNLRFETRDVAQAWEDSRCFDAIVITGGLLKIPASYYQALNPGGRLVAFVGDVEEMHVMKVTRTATGFQEKLCFDAQVPMLKNSARVSTFEFN